MLYRKRIGRSIKPWFPAELHSTSTQRLASPSHYLADPLTLSYYFPLLPLPVPLANVLAPDAPVISGLMQGMARPPPQPFCVPKAKSLAARLCQLLSYSQSLTFVFGLECTG